MKKLTVSQCPTSQYCAGYNVAVDKANDGLAELRKLKDELEGRVSGYEMVLAAHLAENAALKEQVTQLAAFGDTAKHLLSELLAVLHGDGGHHEERVGTAQAVEDAMQLHYKDVETIAQQAEALRVKDEAMQECIAYVGISSLSLGTKILDALAIQPTPDILRKMDITCPECQHIFPLQEGRS